MRLVGGVILLTYSVLALAQNYQSLKKCNEECIPLLQCPKLKKILNQIKDKSLTYSEGNEEIKKHYCYLGRDTYYVCCPRTLVNQNPTSLRSVFDISAKLSLPANGGTYFSTYLPKLKEVKKDDSLSECGRTFNRNYQAGYNTELSDFPWLALLEFNTKEGKKLGCGGVLVSDQHILTAAHCITSPSHTLSSALLGKYDTEATGHCLPDSNLGRIVCANLSQKIEVGKIILPEKYRKGVESRNDEKDYDIALIRLKSKVRFNPYIKPICLPLGKPNVDTYLVSGWGRSQIPRSSGFNQKFMSRLTLVDSKACNEMFPFITDEHICAGTSKLSEHPCISDAGGPLMGFERKPDGVVRMTVFGVSFVDLTCNRTETTEMPGVFTSLHEYVPWIQEKLKE